MTLQEMIKQVQESADQAKILRVLNEFNARLGAEKFTMADDVTLIAAMITGFADGHTDDTTTPVQKQLAFKGHMLNIIGLIAGSLAVELLEASMIDLSKTN